MRAEDKSKPPLLGFGVAASAMSATNGGPFMYEAALLSSAKPLG
jgi:hypothetical protein